MCIGEGFQIKEEVGLLDRQLGSLNNQILAGRNPLAVAVVGSAGVMFVALYLSHGINVRTTSAVLGTLASLAIIAVLGLLVVNLTNLTGFASEEATFLRVASATINL